MEEKVFWQVPGNARPFDRPLREWNSCQEGKSNQSQRSIGVLEFIVANSNKVSKEYFKKNISNFLQEKYGHSPNDSNKPHFYRPLEFIGFMRVDEENISVSIDGKNFLDSIHNKDYSRALEDYIRQLLKARYPSPATPKVRGISLFPYRIILKLLLNNSMSLKTLGKRVVYINCEEDIDDLIKNIDDDNGETLNNREDKWRQWTLRSWEELGVLENKEGFYKLNSNIKPFIEKLIGDMPLEDMFFEEDSLYRKIPLKRKFKRDTSLVNIVREDSNYECFLDDKHETFPNRNKDNYVEVHHIIPMAHQDSFDQNLDCYENLIALCPNCHRAVHHAHKDHKRKLFTFICQSNKLGHFNINEDDLLELLP